MASRNKQRVQEEEEEPIYEDLLPVMADKLDPNQFIQELCIGFKTMADERTGKITAESLMRMGGMSKEEAVAMVGEGDIDRDGMLSEMEFCILMVRLSPEIMDDAEIWLAKAIECEFGRVLD